MFFHGDRDKGRSFLLRLPLDEPDSSTVGLIPGSQRWRIPDAACASRRPGNTKVWPLFPGHVLRGKLANIIGILGCGATAVWMDAFNIEDWTILRIASLAAPLVGCWERLDACVGGCGPATKAILNFYERLFGKVHAVGAHAPAGRNLCLQGLNSPAFLDALVPQFLLPLELERRQHSVPRVLALRVVEHLDVVNVPPALGGSGRCAPDPLALEQVEELSATALSWQLPRRLMECSRSWAFRKAAQSMLVNWLP